MNHHLEPDRDLASITALVKKGPTTAWKRNLTTRVASSFLVLSLLTVATVASVAFLSARGALKQAAYDRLSVTATLKEKEIDRWLEACERDFLLITQFPDVQAALSVLMNAQPDSADYATAYDTLIQYFEDIGELKPQFQEIFLLNRSNRIILSTDRTREGNYEIATNLTYFETVQPGETFTPVFYRSPTTGKPAMTFAAPIRAENGQRQGVILANLNLDRVNQIVRERTGLGETGETYVVGSLVGQNSFISREESGTLAPSEEPHSLGIDTAMQGISGQGLYTNYAGTSVIGVYRWLNDQNIALLVEMSQDEAFAPARQLAGTIMLVGLAAAGVLFIGVHWLARQLKLSREQLENYSHQLEQKAREANAANRAKSEFLANMSHELRTPLNAILGFTQLLIRTPSMNPVQQEHLEIINRSGEHLLTLINDVLEMSKIEAGRITLNENPFDLGRLLDSLEEMFRFKAEAKGLQLRFERSPQVPRCVKTDEGKLRQVLINLLGNAVKFTQEGQVILRVQVDSSEKWGTDTRLLFEVEDTGPGIAPAELRQLFNPFVQAAASSQKAQQGTGLGLSISRRFVQLMGGEITVNSVLDQGSLFKFTIQASPAALLEEPPPIQHRRPIALAPGQSPYRILIVEDRWENRQLLIRLLEPFGFEVQEAVNGQEAIALWKSWEPHLIWMDMRMPVMDGYEATRYIKSHLQGQATVIIALTASAFEESRSIVLAAGCDDFVRKPLQEEVIFDKMTQHLGVQYLYEAEATRSADSAAARSPSQRRNQRSSDTNGQLSLAEMPERWIHELQQAAVQVDADWIFQLLDQIPQERSQLAKQLSDLTHRFCFDEIIELTEQATHVQPVRE